MKLPRGSIWGAAVLVAAIADLYVSVRPDPPELSAEVMRAAGEVMKKVAKPGDVLVASPLFRMAEHAALDVRATPHRPAEKLLASRRVVVLDRTADRMYFPIAPKEVLEVPASDGALEVRVYEPEGSFDVALYSLADALVAGTMRVERNGTVTSRCTQPRAEGGWGCPGEAEWLYAQKRALRVGGVDTDCVWAHPTTGGSIVFELPAQAPPPEGRRLQLTVSAGLTDDAVNMTPDGAPVTTGIVQGGRERSRVVVPNRVGWQKATVNIDPGAPIELRITTARDGRRHHCINAEVLDVAEGAK